ncbi:hypothetical protein BCAR13_110076 [Paraburkholderia caribensis]|nr:hypothetical protein BCAR13_110076 [Paraburkholderia caribensis]
MNNLALPSLIGFAFHFEMSIKQVTLEPVDGIEPSDMEITRRHRPVAFCVGYCSLGFYQSDDHTSPRYITRRNFFHRCGRDACGCNFAGRWKNQTHNFFAAFSICVKFAHGFRRMKKHFGDGIETLLQFGDALLPCRSGLTTRDYESGDDRQNGTNSLDPSRIRLLYRRRSGIHLRRSIIERGILA